MLRKVADRLGPGARVADVVTDGGGAGWRACAEPVGAVTNEDTVVVGHGLAVPAAVAVAERWPVRGLVLSDGPVTRLDPVTAHLVALSARAPALLHAALLQPAVWTAWLRSSAGLRRAVVNPYVMDRDTVAALCGSIVATAALRTSFTTYLQSLATLPDVTRLRCPVAAVWGDDDWLYPASEASFLVSAHAGAPNVAIPGGRFGHPEERPWALADAVRELSSQLGTAPSAAAAP